MNQFPLRVRIDLVAEVVDVNLSFVSACVEIVFADVFGDYRPCQNLVYVADKIFQQCILAVGQLDFSPTALCLTGQGVELEISDF